MKIVQNHATDCFDWLISGRQSVNFYTAWKYERFAIVHPVSIDLKFADTWEYHEAFPKGKLLAPKDL